VKTIKVTDKTWERLVAERRGMDTNEDVLRRLLDEHDRVEAHHGGRPI